MARRRRDAARRPKPRELEYHDLDQGLIVWGVAKAGIVTAVGRGREGSDRVDELIDNSDGSTGTPVYYHPSRERWVDAGTGLTI